MVHNRDKRSLKLHKSYKKEWATREDDALTKLTEKLKLQSKKKALVEKRISVMNHDRKVREKQEIHQMIEIVKD